MLPFTTVRSVLQFVVGLIVGASVVVVGGAVAGVVGATAGRSVLGVATEVGVGTEVGLVTEGGLVVVVGLPPPGSVEVEGRVVLGRLTEGRPDPEPPQETRIIPKRSDAPTAMPILMLGAVAARTWPTSLAN